MAKANAASSRWQGGVPTMGKQGGVHAFWGEGGAVVVGEVSSVNDDIADNVFAEPLARFTRIEEDAQPYRLLVTDDAGAGSKASDWEDGGYRSRWSPRR